MTGAVVRARVYSKALLLGVRGQVDPDTSPPWLSVLLPDGGLEEVRLASPECRFEVCEMTRIWEAVESLLVRETAEISSPEITRLPVGTLFETTGLSRRILIDGRGQVVRMQIKLPPSPSPPLSSSCSSSPSPSPSPVLGWVTASSTACGSEGRVYVSAPSSESIHSAGFSAFLLSHGRKFLLMDDAPVYPKPDAQIPTAKLHWGWHVQQFGLPHAACADTEIRIQILFPVPGWIVAKRLRRFPFPSDGPLLPQDADRGTETLLRPYAREGGEDLARGCAGEEAKALMTMQLRTEAETSAPVIGNDLYEGRVVLLAGPCVLTDFRAGDTSSQFIRAPVIDATHHALLTPRWATVGAVNAVNGAVNYFMHIPGPKMPHSSLLPQKTVAGGPFKWNLQAEEFRPSAGGGGGGGKGLGVGFTFPRVDGSLGVFRVAVRGRGFENASGFSRRRVESEFRVGEEVRQKSAVFWREEVKEFMLHVQKTSEEEQWVRERVAVQWMQVEEDNVWLPIMEISIMSGKNLKYLKRVADRASILPLKRIDSDYYY